MGFNESFRDYTDNELYECLEKNGGINHEDLTRICAEVLRRLLKELRDERSPMDIIHSEYLKKIDPRFNSKNTEKEPFVQYREDILDREL